MSEIALHARLQPGRYMGVSLVQCDFLLKVKVVVHIFWVLMSLINASLTSWIRINTFSPQKVKAAIHPHLGVKPH